MSYEVAINKAWQDLANLNPAKEISVRFLADEYHIDTDKRQVISLASSVPVRDFTAILILHYLVTKLKTLPLLTGEWVTFKELSAVEGYYPAFRKRAIEPIISKFGNNPQGLLGVLDRFPGKRVDQADIGLVLEAFAGVPVMITFWRQDEEFGSEANILFDKSIRQIFCTEDIVVLAGMIASAL